ncbi:MAG: hypothetical protein OWQ54_08940 [Sulfolobaceae archaeon]|nr:hypothetical protein [Sulfolobaceae archaeon]
MEYIQIQDIDQMYDNLERTKGLAKTVNAKIDGKIIDITAPDTPQTYVSETDGIIYINGNDWKMITTVFEDVKEEALLKLKRFIRAEGGRIPSDPTERIIGVDEAKRVQEAKAYFYALKDGKRYEVGIHYRIFMPYPERGRNGFVEIALYTQE